MKEYLAGQQLECLESAVFRQLAAKYWDAPAVQRPAQGPSHTVHGTEQQPDFPATDFSDLRKLLFKYRSPQKPVDGSCRGLYTFLHTPDALPKPGQLLHSDQADVAKSLIIVKTLELECHASSWPVPGLLQRVKVAAHLGFGANTPAGQEVCFKQVQERSAQALSPAVITSAMLLGLIDGSGLPNVLAHDFDPRTMLDYCKAQLFADIQWSPVDEAGLADRIQSMSAEAQARGPPSAAAKAAFGPDGMGPDAIEVAPGVHFKAMLLKEAQEMNFKLTGHRLGPRFGSTTKPAAQAQPEGSDQPASSCMQAGPERDATGSSPAGQQPEPRQVPRQRTGQSGLHRAFFDKPAKQTGLRPQQSPEAVKPAHEIGDQKPPLPAKPVAEPPSGSGQKAAGSPARLKQAPSILLHDEPGNHGYSAEIHSQPPLHLWAVEPWPSWQSSSPAVCAQSPAWHA